MLPSYDVTNQRAEYRLIAYHNPARYRAAGTSGITLCQLCAGRDAETATSTLAMTSEIE
jgi:hypothetical protein